MRILFVQDNGINESLALTELSACLRARGHCTAVLIEREERDLVRAARDQRPDLLLIPASILAHRWALGVAERLRAGIPHVPIVFAGSHPTFFPDVIEFPAVDMVLIGEAEGPLLALLDALGGHGSLAAVPGLVYKSGGAVHRNPLGPLPALDDMPLPDRALYFDRYRFMARFPWKKFTSGRGCFYSCAYCYQPGYRQMMSASGTYIRRKSPARVVAEVREVASRWRTTHVHFSDDLFITDPEWLREFSAIYGREVRLPYSMNTTADYVTAESVELLRASGCRAVALGVETIDERIRHEVLHKRVSNERIRAAAARVREAGLKLVTFNMLAAPYDTLESGLATMQFNAELGVTLARVSICFPIPGTAMTRRALVDGICRDGFTGNIYDIPDMGSGRPRVHFTTAQRDEAAFVNLYHLFNWGVRFPSLIPLIRLLVRAPRNPLYALANGLRLLQERTLFEFSLLDGLRYFRHVGPPDRRTTNFVSLV